MQKDYLSLQIPGLTLRLLQAADAVVLHRIYQAEGVLRYFPNPAPPLLEKVERFIAHQQVHWDIHGYGNWGLLPDGEDYYAWKLRWETSTDLTPEQVHELGLAEVKRIQEELRAVVEELRYPSFISLNERVQMANIVVA